MRLNIDQLISTKTMVTFDPKDIYLLPRNKEPHSITQVLVWVRMKNRGESFELEYEKALSEDGKVLKYTDAEEAWAVCKHFNSHYPIPVHWEALHVKIAFVY